MAVRGCLILLFVLLTGIAHTFSQLSGSSTVDPTTITTSNSTNSSTEATTPTIAPTFNVTSESPVTTPQNSTNYTTEVPTTTHSNVTSVPTPPPTTPPVPKPAVGNYSIKSNTMADCLLANMGLQFIFKVGDNANQTVNLDPTATAVNGTCGSGGSDSSLLLTTKDITVLFVFTNASKKFHLHTLSFTIDLGNGNIFYQSNNNMSLWEASVGSSYMCKKEQSYVITDNFTLNTFELQVQPFDIKNNMFSTAHECSMDDASLLIPIIVGAALAGLILIVVIAYVIGRRRTYVGYQTL
ncbi:hypothetical protein DNTS_000296 [Danionella cerebrum]|uniref:Lysosomal-associated membrane protein 2 n=1 Tax=Danionella cerebrum TaxID=2873325 RepID=A0A553R707_9TELE|nr:hypothetical protein DNTS_000296 [Danionella translucida]